jgi:NTP pyrophosphatase (non-canonical NTP hydrolase)
MTIETHTAMVQRLKSDDYLVIANRMIASPEIIDIDHAINGIHTEGAELADQFKRYKYYGTELDYVNIKEEVGDLLYYVQLLAAAAGFTLEEAMDSNEDKLNARFGDGFSEDAAVNRDLDKERATLERDVYGYTANIGEMPVDEGTLIDFEHHDGQEFFSKPCGTGACSNWELGIGDGTVVKWRLA